MSNTANSFFILLYILWALSSTRCLLIYPAEMHKNFKNIKHFSQLWCEMIHKVNQFSRFCNTRVDYFLNIQNAKAIGINTSILQMHIRRFETYDILYFLFWKESQPIGQLINTSHVQQLPTAINKWKYLLQTLRVDSARTQNTCHFLDTEFLIQIIASSWQFHSTSSSSGISPCNGCSGYSTPRQSLSKAGCCSGSCDGRNRSASCSKGSNLSPADSEYTTQSNNNTNLLVCSHLVLFQPC